MALENPNDETCNRIRTANYLTIPRTCVECGLGPCKKGYPHDDTPIVPSDARKTPPPKTLTLSRLERGGFVVGERAPHPEMRDKHLFAGDLDACLDFITREMQ